MLKTRAAKICAGLLLFFLIIRIGVFGFFRKRVTKKQYDRPVPLDHFALKGREVPDPFDLDTSSEKGRVPRKILGAEALKVIPRDLDLSLEPAGEALVSAYRGRNGGKVLVLVFVLADPAKAAQVSDTLNDSASTATWRVSSFSQNDRLCLGLGRAPASPAALLAAIHTKVKAKKAWLGKVEKLKVIGNAIMKVMIDILVFGFIFVVVLFLVKWIFIIRPLQEK